MMMMMNILKSRVDYSTTKIIETYSSNILSVVVRLLIYHLEFNVFKYSVLCDVNKYDEL